MNLLEVLFQSVYLSVDPYMRLFGTEEGQTMTGEHLAEYTHIRIITEILKKYLII